MIEYSLYWILAALSVGIFWALPVRLRFLFLGLACVLFIASVEPVTVLMMLVISGLVYIPQSQTKGRPLFAGLNLALIVLVAGFLFYFKYLPAIAKALNESYSFANLLLPLGISYFAFKIIHFVIERARGHLPEYGFWDYLAWLFLVPIFTAGPIQRFDLFITQRSATWQNAARQFGTPLYVYDLDMVRARIDLLRTLFGGQFDISYAIKANPNAALLDGLQPVLDTFDASSFAEVERAISAGMPAERISFSGPAKRIAELEGALRVGVGELILESVEEAEDLSRLAQTLGQTQACLIRINPDRVPRKFGASMAGTASQFGIDEADIATDLPKIAALPGIRVEGFHIYSGTNCLDPEAIAENFGIFADIFSSAAALLDIAPKRLIFGSGFGVPYLPDETELDHGALPELVQPVLDRLMADPRMRQARCVLELGRWLAAPAGWLLTSVIRQKQSRGKAVRMCDAGFNNHLAACGMMGSVFRRNWVYENLTNPTGAVGPYTLTGPLCTTIDRLGVDIELPEPRVQDVIAIPQSGAYGLTASPSRFISHPEPREAIWSKDDSFINATESQLNHWQGSVPT